MGPEVKAAEQCVECWSWDTPARWVRIIITSTIAGVPFQRHSTVYSASLWLDHQVANKTLSIPICEMDKLVSVTGYLLSPGSTATKSLCTEIDATVPDSCCKHCKDVCLLAAELDMILTV